MTIKDRRLHDQYGSAPTSQFAAINDAFEAARDVIAAAGFATAVDDRAENLVAEIYRYLRDSEAGRQV